MKNKPPITFEDFNLLEDKHAEAWSILCLARELIEPDGHLPTPEKPFDREWLTQDARYGLVFSLDRVADTLVAFRDALSDCVKE